jgi:hypothetical protein
MYIKTNEGCKISKKYISKFCSNLKGTFIIFFIRIFHYFRTSWNKEATSSTSNLSDSWNLPFIMSSMARIESGRTRFLTHYRNKISRVACNIFFLWNTRVNMCRPKTASAASNAICRNRTEIYRHWHLCKIWFVCSYCFKYGEGT